MPQKYIFKNHRPKTQKCSPKKVEGLIQKHLENRILKTHK